MHLIRILLSILDLFDPLYSGFFKGKWVFVILTVECCGLQDSQDNSLRDFSIKWVNNLFKCGSIIQRKLTHFCAHSRVLGWGFSHHGHHTHVHRGIQGYHTEMESEFYVLCIVLDFFSRQIGFPSKEKSNWVEVKFQFHQSLGSNPSSLVEGIYEWFHSQHSSLSTHIIISGICFLFQHAFFVTGRQYSVIGFIVLDIGICVSSGRIYLVPPPGCLQNGFPIVSVIIQKGLKVSFQVIHVHLFGE